MNPYTLRTFALVGILTVFAAASAQAQFRSDAMVVDIPFAFRVGDAALPAGSYMVKPMPHSSGFLVQETRSRKAAIALAAATVQAKPQQAQAKLVFRRYGEQYFLAQIWRPDLTVGNEVPVSRAERRLTRDLKRTEPPLAQGATEPELVTLVPRR